MNADAIMTIGGVVGGGVLLLLTVLLGVVRSAPIGTEDNQGWHASPEETDTP